MAHPAWPVRAAASGSGFVLGVVAGIVAGMAIGAALAKLLGVF